MDKFSRILKQTLLFLVIFLAINWIFSFFQNDEEDLVLNSGNLLFTTTDTEYSRRQIVTVKMRNGTNETITIPNECPSEPFSVFIMKNNEWIEKTADPELNCAHSKDLILAPNEELRIPYNNWNHALFSEMGRFKIEFTTEIDGEEKTFTTNEFIVKKEGIFKQLWTGVFYRPIYNGLIFFSSVMPGHNLGLAIILLTIVIRTILLVPSQKAMKAQRRMQEIQPRLQKIKEKYKGDQQRIAMETMALWKEAKINPMGSCLPLLLQLPFLIAIFYVVQNGLNPDQSYLLYTQYANFNIGDINPHFLGLDLTERNLYVLPLIIGALQFIQMKLAMVKNKKKKDEKNADAMQNQMAMATSMMTYIMPIMIAVFTATLPAGVGIYWGTSTLYGIVQQFFVNRGKTTAKSDENEPTVRVIKTN